MITVHAYILRRTKTTQHKILLTLLTDKLGKITVNSYERSNLKKGGALQAFACYEMELSDRNGRYKLDSCSLVNQYYDVSMDPDRYVFVSYMTELLLKAIPEHAPAQMYDIYHEYLIIATTRTKGFGTLRIAYQVKILQELGMWSSEDRFASDVLISKCEGDIVNVLVYITEHPSSALKSITLRPDIESRIVSVMDAYIRMHLGVGDFNSDRYLA